MSQVLPGIPFVIHIPGIHIKRRPYNFIATRLKQSGYERTLEGDRQLRLIIDGFNKYEYANKHK